MIVRLLKKAVRNWVDAADGADFAARFERTKSLRNMPPVSIGFEDGLYVVKSDGETVHVARKPRLEFQYKNGIRKRRQALMAEYCVPEGLVRQGDIVVDCGANIGEFSMVCASEGAAVYSFEPDRVEYQALERNAEPLSIEPIQAALWNENGETTFYDSNDEGDSSLIQPSDYSGSYAVKTMRLDDFPNLKDAQIRLIKLEAEGAEPEILEGMTETLKRTQYITVDMGPERGVSQSPTLIECTNVLTDAGFRMKDFHPGRYTALFEAMKSAPQPKAAEKPKARELAG